MKVSLVILTLNEIVGLNSIFDKIPFESVDEVFAVDGGSTDGTLAFFQERKITVYSQEVRGRGEAFRVAFRKAKGDALILFSPDGNEDPLDIPKFKPFLESGADIVIATRMTREGHNEEDDQFFKWRKWVNNAFTLIANIIWNRGKFVTDTINGYRAITKKAWDILALDGPGYTIEYQGSIRAFKKKLNIVEFPTFESVRIDNGFGSPSLATGMAFIKIFLYELKVGKNWRALRESEADVQKKSLFRTFWNG